MGQLVYHTSFQFNGTVVETFSVAIVFSFFTITGVEIFDRSPGKQAVGSPLWSFSFLVKLRSSLHSISHHRTGGNGSSVQSQARPPE
jgi:hypothetical protein